MGQAPGRRFLFSLALCGEGFTEPVDLVLLNQCFVLLRQCFEGSSMAWAPWIQTSQCGAHHCL
tara:strand:- start:860 stop:1048 length:189 start_codon:yes stop_codon:yes gene_type:complete